MLDDIRNKAASLKDEIIRFRRELHRNPELSGHEKKTAVFVAEVLRDNGIETLTGVGGHGVVGLIRGGHDGPTIALRADMDALPVHEKNQSDYSSSVSGVMHACGHDVHTSVLLGVAVVLSGLKDRLRGGVKLIFQPSEEAPPGGAKAMIDEGALLNPTPSAMAALHCYPELEVGKAGYTPGVMTASSDRFTIGIKGKGGHAARPHQTVDAVLAASMVVAALHHIVSRRIDPTQNAVISIGSINGGTAPNVIADYVEMKGTVRTLDAKLRKKMPLIMEETVKGLTMGMGAAYDFHYEFGCPSVVNDRNMTGLVRECSAELLGVENTIEMPRPQMGAEDFSYFAEKVPAALFRLGTGNAKKGINHPLHSPDFDIDEDAIPIGVALMSWIAVKYLNYRDKPGG